MLCVVGAYTYTQGQFVTRGFILVSLATLIIQSAISSTISAITSLGKFKLFWYILLIGLVFSPDQEVEKFTEKLQNILMVSTLYSTETLDDYYTYFYLLLVIALGLGFYTFFATRLTRFEFKGGVPIWTKSKIPLAALALMTSYHWSQTKDRDSPIHFTGHYFIQTTDSKVEEPATWNAAHPLSTNEIPQVQKNAQVILKKLRIFLDITLDRRPELHLQHNEDLQQIHFLKTAYNTTQQIGLTGNLTRENVEDK